MSQCTIRRRSRMATPCAEALSVGAITRTTPGVCADARFDCGAQSAQREAPAAELVQGALRRTK